MTPLAIDLFCGLGGWTDGLLAEGYDVIGFDLDRHQYGEHRYPARLVLQDVLTLHGRQFKDAALIVASPPCQKFSYMTMPWSKAKQIEREYMTGVRDRAQLTALFDACFRIQREACEAAGRHIPLVVENVRGAQKWVGRSRWNYGSFHLWGDVPALMPMAKGIQKFNPDGTAHSPGSWFAIADSKNRGAHIKNTGGSWFNTGSPGQEELNRNRVHELVGLKLKDQDGYERTHSDAFGWKIPRTSSHSKARKAASAMIARIPLPLARYIAAVFKPMELCSYAALFAQSEQKEKKP